mgnify:CR=1 FL=1
MAEKKLTVTLVHSAVTQVKKDQTATCRAMGLRKIGDVAVLPDNAPFLNQTFVDIDLADVVYDHSEAYALTVVQDVVQKSCLSAAKIACEQQHG